jgi:hypothetical protein
MLIVQSSVNVVSTFDAHISTVKMFLNDDVCFVHGKQWDGITECLQPCLFLTRQVREVGKLRLPNRVLHRGKLLEHKIAILLIKQGVRTTTTFIQVTTVYVDEFTLIDSCRFGE